MERPSIFFWRPATTYYLIGGLVLLLVGIVIAYIVSTFQPTVFARTGAAVYHLTLADTEGERAKGLAGVKKLGSSEGLLMKFDSDDKWGIWMKNMEIPIDIIWLNSGKKVVHIEKNVSPELGTDEVFTPKDPARYVIELAAGGVEAAAIKKGSVFVFDETDTGGVWW